MNKKEDTKQRLEELVELINQHNIHYHQNDDPIITDGEFDKLVREYTNLKKNILIWFLKMILIRMWAVN